MIKALYGHPRAGDLWADKLGGVLRQDGFTSVTGWPSMYIKHIPGEPPQVFDVYVDDLIMLGSREGLGATLRRIRKVIDMEEPTSSGSTWGAITGSWRGGARARVKWKRKSSGTCRRITATLLNVM